MSRTVKRGDRETITVTANMDLTGCDVRLLARVKYTKDPIELTPTEWVDQADGVVSHTLDGTLDPGTYEIELEVTRDEEGPHTFPNDSYLELDVIDDIG